MKKYSLTKEEQANLSSRKALKQQYSYLLRLVEHDMAVYTDVVIKGRLGLKEEDVLVVDIEDGTATKDEEQTADTRESLKGDPGEKGS